ncbi:strawberry notch-like NTP hydrolase domain-containing protein [Croceicoccus hydrothermalis]|uniref:strawberry notch-like NTP hydrolase domain-containing protein n=1 Tax=Croceicoccus hydrothermalis TaxID=2867964 RepID=UPI003B8399B9
MTDLFDHQATRLDAAIDCLAGQISKGELNKTFLHKTMRELHGAGSADGAWTQRGAFDLMEAALVRHLTSAAKPTGLGDIEAFSQIMQALPTQTVRSETQIRYQQFSTPADLAALVAVLAQARQDDLVLEPSAGHGILAAVLPKVRTLHLNEIDPDRREKLAILFPQATLTGVDGAMLTSLLDETTRPSLIVMNPPFSRSEGRGVDQFAAIRHLRSAISKTSPRGRIVAIMPDWFTTSARMLKIYEETFANCTVRSSCRIDKCYQKQGTTVAVRLYVIDKIPGVTKPAVLARDTVQALAEELNVPPRSNPERKAPGAAAERPKPTLFRAMRSTPRPKVIAPRAVPTQEITAVAYDTLDRPRPLGEQKGVYLPYRPSRIDIANASTHPTPLVESVAMGSIPAPQPEYLPQLHARIVTEQRLSEAQLETVIYAGNAWSQFLPGLFKPDEKGVGLTLSEDGEAYRKGYFLGDGTGAGKGRQIAGCILDNWLAGRKRAIWVSKNEQLLEDARRDWEALGGMSADIQPLSAWKIDQSVPFRDGIVFVTYPTLRSQRQDATRLKQLLDWAGNDFEGVIAFDESHEMGGVAGGEGLKGAKNGSQQGIAGVLLQNHLPHARVLYASATGASDVNNLAYAVRLGLWGPETAFANREDFISQIRAGGIAAMELVSRDLKALGLYQSRALSFAGVEYEILKHELTPEQVSIYDAYAEAWAIIHQNMETALALTNVVDDLEGSTLNSGAKAAARSRFESCKQRFFNQVLLSMKLPSLIGAIDQHLADGKSVVIQLVSTAESILNRRLNSLSPEERANLELDLSPRENVIDYLERAFPTQQMKVFVDDTGAERSMPLYDDDGRPVHNQQALECKAALIEQLCAMPPIKPALDGLIEHYGTDAVAEVTGRTKRLICQSDGSQKLESRSSRTNQSETDQFMDGRKRILIFSDAGGTGRSYHASLKAKNQQQRVHFLLEPGWRADRAIQGLGRTHRTHQATTPLFRPVTTDCKGELRFTSTIARRLDSLGALTRGQRQTGGQNLFDPADNLESEYAKAALVTWFGLLADGKLKSTTMLDFERRSGLKLTEEGGVLVEELPPIQRWLNRILALPIHMQNEIFDEFLGLVEARVSAAREAGSLDVGVETIQVESARITKDVILRTDERTGATSHLLTIELESKQKPVALDRILEMREWAKSPKLLVNRKSGRVALCEDARSFMEDTGDLIPRVVLNRPVRRQYKLLADLSETAWESCDEAAFRKLWQAEVTEAAARTTTETIHLATGLLLPIWSSLPRDYMAVNRIVDKDGSSWLGRLVHDSDVSALLSSFGVDSEYIPSVAAIIAALAQNRSTTLRRPFPITIKRSLVAGEHRIELAGELGTQLAWLKSLGCFTEIIQYKTRIFAPATRAEAILAALLAVG